jgi:hypothetical protein
MSEEESTIDEESQQQRPIANDMRAHDDDDDDDDDDENRCRDCKAKTICFSVICTCFIAWLCAAVTALVLAVIHGPDD